jgi:RNA polymerase sigma-70 factor (ECF subfamily)
LSTFAGFKEHPLEMSRESEVLQRAAAAFIRDRNRLGAFVGGLLRDSHAAEDVIQEVWLRLAAEVEKGTVLDNQPAWCRGVAKNLILKHWRKQRNAKVVADSAVLEVFLARVDEAFAETDESADLWERRQQALDECVAALPEKSRRLLSLRYEGRESVENVAGRVGQSFDAVTKALYRLRQALSDCVERKLSHP